MSHAFALRERAGKEGGGKGPLVQEEVIGTLTPGNDQRIFHAIPIKPDVTPKFGSDGDAAYTLRAREKGGGFEDSVCMSDEPVPIDPNDWIARGLTPVECERLQGFPDGHTDLTGCDAEAIAENVCDSLGITSEKERTTMLRKVRRWSKSCPDAPRYKACGNSMAVPCIEWLGERIEMVDAIVEDLMLEC